MGCGDPWSRVCFAVHEAHPALFTRDLPENIWPEPNCLAATASKCSIKQQSAGSDTSSAGEDYGTEASNRGMDGAADSAGDGDTEGRSVVPSPNHRGIPPRCEIEPGGCGRDFGHRRPPGEVDAAGLTHAWMPGGHGSCPPEQCRGQKLDARSDILSVGSLRTRCSRGTTPFTGGDEGHSGSSQMNRPPAGNLTAGVPSRVSATVIGRLWPRIRRPGLSALAFANALRANATGLGAFRTGVRALATNHFPKVVALFVPRPPSGSAWRIAHGRRSGLGIANQ